ncbi:hypothetical protein [Streptomyces sp. NPDC054783]
MPYRPNGGTAPRNPYPQTGVVDLNPAGMSHSFLPRADRSGGRSGRLAAQEVGAGVGQGESPLKPGHERVVDAVAPGSFVPLEQRTGTVRKDAALYRLDAGQRADDLRRMPTGRPRAEFAAQMSVPVEECTSTYSLTYTSDNPPG